MDGSVLLSKHGSIQVSVKDLSARINTLFVYLPTHQPPYRHQTDRDRPPRQHFIPCHYASEFRAEGNKRTVYGQRRKKGAIRSYGEDVGECAGLDAGSDADGCVIAVEGAAG